MNGLTKAASDVLAERQRQDAKWGGPGHDDHHTVAQWVELIQDYAGWARVMAGMDSHDKARRRLVQVSALALAAAESLDRLHDATVCGNCDTAVPPGCGGIFKDDGSACALNRAHGVPPSLNDQGENHG
jgi:hypothetical protein